VISYVIVGSAKALLFDTGMGIGKMRRVVEGLTAKPVTVLNSHAHHDHVGGNAEFERAMGMDNAFSRKNAEGRRGLGPEVLKADRICGALPAGVTTESYVIGPWTISEIVRDGSRIALGGREVEVIATPGHTPDSLCLYDAKNRLLFTGDTFYPGPIYLFGGETNLADYANSSDRLAKLAPQVNLLLPGHNVPVAEPRNLSRLAAAIKQVRSGQGTPKNNGGLREYQFDGFSILTR
jgi:glyoxylase-like metal-dependent hydrolase (beta-lactamase superfamily II)